MAIIDDTALGMTRPQRAASWQGKPATYYGIPLLKKAGWEWQIILYFFLGGIAGTSYLVATLADVFRLKGARELIRAGRYLSFVCILASPVFLIWDLGRPERFHHMLRVFKLRSVMSLGTWAISFFGLCCGLTTARQMAEDGLLNWLPLLARMTRLIPVRLLELAGSFFGLFVAAYTGVLLSSTANPLWAKSRYLLGPLFLTSGLSTALASLTILLSIGRSPEQDREREMLEDAEIAALSTEMGLITSLVPTLGTLSKPLFSGRVGRLFVGGTVVGGVTLPLVVRVIYRLMGRPVPRSVSVGTSLLVLVGGMILRYAWIVAGRASADDPVAVHEYNAGVDVKDRAI